MLYLCHVEAEQECRHHSYGSLGYHRLFLVEVPALLEGLMEYWLLALPGPCPLVWKDRLEVTWPSAFAPARGEVDSEGVCQQSNFGERSCEFQNFFYLNVTLGGTSSAI